MAGEELSMRDKIKLLLAWPLTQEELALRADVERTTIRRHLSENPPDPRPSFVHRVNGLLEEMAAARKKQALIEAALTQPETPRTKGELFQVRQRGTDSRPPGGGRA